MGLYVRTTGYSLDLLHGHVEWVNWLNGLCALHDKKKKIALMLKGCVAIVWGKDGGLGDGNWVECVHYVLVLAFLHFFFMGAFEISAFVLFVWVPGFTSFLFHYYYYYLKDLDFRFLCIYKEGTKCVSVSSRRIPLILIATFSSYTAFFSFFCLVYNLI